MCRNKQLSLRYVIALLAALWWSAGAIAETPPVVSSSTNYTHVGGYIIPLAMTSYTTWTGNVTTLIYTDLTDPVHGSLWDWDSSGQVEEYDCDSTGFIGTDSFQWCAANGNLTSDVATCFIITTNCVPVARNGAMTVTYAAMVRLFLSYNHPDQNQVQTFMFPTLPAHGTLQPDPDWGPWGGYDYYPNTNLSIGGTDSFVWQMSDGISTSATAVYNITLTPYIAPAANAQNLTFGENSTTNRINLSYSVHGASTIIFTLGAVPAHGTLSNSFSGTLQAGSALTNTAVVYYTPTVGYTGVDSFVWNIFDGVTTSASATATITLSQQPPAINNPSASLTCLRNSTNNLSSFLAYTHADVGQTVTYTLIRAPTNGILQLNGTGSALTPGTFSSLNWTYAPNPGFTGGDSFTWSVSDGMASCTRTGHDHGSAATHTGHARVQVWRETDGRQPHAGARHAGRERAQRLCRWRRKQHG